MEFHFDSIDPLARYKLLTGIVVPRPIAWITTCNHDGSINAAPFSFFNAFGTEPGIVALGIGNHPDRPKDTLINIERSGQFVVNLVPESLAQSMSDSATAYPANVSEITALAIKTTPSSWVTPPRIVGCPAVLECQWNQTVLVGSNQVIFGIVQGVFVEDQCIQDSEKYLIASDKLQLIGRMGGADVYTRTTDRLLIARKAYTAP